MAGLQPLRPTSQATVPANRWLPLLLSAILSVFLATNSFALLGDLDNDCNVDQDDLTILLVDRNKSVGDSSCGAACDLDRDGTITVLDGRKLVLLCTLSRCAVMEDSCTGPENKAPTADAGQNRIITLEPEQDTIIVTLNGSGSTDADGDIVEYLWQGTPDPDDAVTSQVTLSPGEYTFTLTVTDNDGAASSPDSVQIIVEASVITEQHQPQITVDPPQLSVNEGAIVTAIISASDQDNEIVSISASPNLDNAEFTAVSGLAASGTFTFSPDADQQGLYVIKFTARDPHGNSNSKTLQLTVNNSNRPPAITVPHTLAVDEGALLTIPITATDPDDDLLTVTAEPLPSGAIFIPATGTISFAPDFEQAGNYTIICTASDGSLSSSADVVITVNDIAGGGGDNELVLNVDDPQSPTLLASTSITGTVNMSGSQQPQRLEAALITTLLPVSGRQGETLDVTLRGQESGDFVTHFEDGVSQVNFGEGVTVNAVTVNSETELTVNITIGPRSTVGTRAITVTSGSETAVSMLAFNILTGASTITGILTDPETGQPIGGAVITVQGTDLTTTTGSDGSFTFADVPGGGYVLIINPADHELITMEVTTVTGTVADIGAVETRSLVFDPTAPPAVSLHSVLARNLGDVTGSISIDEARRVIIDTMILVGGNQAGVLDTFGNQLNPYVEGKGLTSMRDFGVQFYAERLVRGGAVSLIEVLYDISFAFNWTPQRPTYLQLLNGLQNRVNQAWSNPLDPMSVMPVILFNHGRTFNPDPPTLAATTQLNSFQAYLLINSFMVATYTSQQDPQGTIWPPDSRILKRIGQLAMNFLATPAWAANEATYTRTWSDLMTDLGISADAEPISDVVTEEQPPLPSAEEIYRKYYLGMNEMTTAQGVVDLRQLMINGGVPEDEIDAALNIRGKNAYHYATEMAMDKARHNVQIQQAMAHFSDLQFQRFEIQTGPIPYLGVGDYSSLMRPDIFVKSQAPDPPYIKILESGEAVNTLTVGGSSFNLPAVEIVFYRSSNQEVDKDPRVKYFYRLWRQGSDKTRKIYNDATDEESADWVLLNIGEAGGDDVGAPSIPDMTNKHILKFVDPLPPPGRLSYRVDVVKVKGNNSIISRLEDDDLAKIQPWFSGFMDDPIQLNKEESNYFGGIGRARLFPGSGFLIAKNVWYYVSGLSNTFGVYVTGEPAHLRTFPRVDLAGVNTMDKVCEQEYDKNMAACTKTLTEASTVCDGLPDSDKDSCFAEAEKNAQNCRAQTKEALGACAYNLNRVYVSIPSLGAEGRGSGVILEYDYESSALNLFSRPGFMTPGQIGLALDNNGDLFMDNAASDAFYGGRIFRIRGATSAGAGQRDLIGSINYYSRLLQFAHPTAVQQLAFGNATAPGKTTGEAALFIADANDNAIKTIFLSDNDIANADHNSSRLWMAQQSGNQSLPPEEREFLSFGPQTDLAFDKNYQKLFVSQGNKVLMLEKEGDKRTSIASTSNFFTNATGLVVCGDQLQTLFVADDIPGEDNGKIYRIPLADIPFTVPSNSLEQERQRAGYTFLYNLDKPMSLAVSADNGTLLIADDGGFRYLRFGFSGTALGVDDLPMIGAVVTVNSEVGTFSTTSDTEGNYHFTGINLAGKPQALTVTISHPDHSYTERIFYAGQCHSNLDPTPCINIHQPANGAELNAGTTTVGGQVLPKAVPFHTGMLLVDGVSYPVTFDTNNEFSVPDVVLRNGINTMTMMVDQAGSFSSGGSLPTEVERITSQPDIQATAGTILDDEGNPRSNVTVRILVDDDLRAEIETDGCGYYNAGGLPPGTVSIEIEE